MEPIPPVFDPEEFNFLLELCDKDDLPLIESAVRLFLEDLEPLLGRLDEAMRCGDFKGVSEAAHSLKGGSATFGLLRMRMAARELELAANASAIAEMEQWGNTLHASIGPACEALRIHLEYLREKAISFDSPPNSR